MKIFKVLFLTYLVASMFGCGSSSNNSATTTTAYGYNASGVCVITSTGVAVATSYCTSTSTYSYNTSGVCVITSTGVAVATSYCSTSTTSTYYSYNTAGACIITSTGTVVATTYCTSTTTTTTGSCVGTYYWCPYGISAGLSNCQSGYCNGTNCKGYTMYTSALAAVTCQ